MTGGFKVIVDFWNDEAATNIRESGFVLANTTAKVSHQYSRRCFVRQFRIIWALTIAIVKGDWLSVVGAR